MESFHDSYFPNLFFAPRIDLYAQDIELEDKCSRKRQFLKIATCKNYIDEKIQNGKFSHSSVVEMIPIENLQRPAINEKEAEIGQYFFF